MPHNCNKATRGIVLSCYVCLMSSGFGLSFHGMNLVRVSNFGTFGIALAGQLLLYGRTDI